MTENQTIKARALSHWLTQLPHIPSLPPKGWESCVPSLPQEAGTDGKVVVQAAGDTFYFQWQHRARTFSVTSWAGSSTKQAHRTNVPMCQFHSSTGITSQHMMDHCVVSCTGKENTWVTCCLLKYLYSDSERRICCSSFLHIKVI